MAVRFLDNMHDLHQHSAPSLALNSLGTRKIGVGIMGFAHLLVLLGVPYGSRESEILATQIGSVLFAAAGAESERLAKLRGPFPAWCSELGLPERRNACLSAIAGTATLALLVGTTGGIEPIFSHLAKNRVMGQELLVLDPLVSYVLQDVGFDIAEATSRLLDGECLHEIVGSELADILPIALEIPGDAHIRIQAAFQRQIDGGITKTINCATNTSIDEIGSWVRLAHSKGCMGLTIYRNESLLAQPFSHAL
jgi:ribonucleoside-diphosphate reductase alpha chain